MRNKTMRVKQVVILEGFKKGDYEFECVPTEDMVADIYTKPIWDEISSFQENHHEWRPGF